ncbi:MAG: hypothetical protein PHG07_04085 [Lachnospiraceae bacterium]|nr:hypothetical protein [Lachnospiraceae bacterium]
MALTKGQANGVIRLFVSAFLRERDNKKRKILFSEFEDCFGRSITDWKKTVRKN